MTNTSLNVSEAPEDLRKISLGLALSGGGYRAAAFHLGMLAYLDRIRLLPQLRRLSTVSGGTFTGMKYILSLVEGVAFSSFFQDLYSFLLNENLFKKGLIDLSHGFVRVPSGERKLILSLANVYADSFLKSPQGSPYTFKSILESNIPVEEISFNATEFRTGVAFRFQKSANLDAKIGNGNVNISNESAKYIRLADIVAASSCFPGGFEPMAFPQDFAWPNNQIPNDVQSAIRGNGQFNSLALMDGGIYDNQGIDSLLLADKRKGTGELGLFIISDVDSAQDSLYIYPQNDQPSSNLTLGQLDWIVRIFLLVCVLTVLSITYELWRTISQATFVFWQDFFSILMPIILAAGVIFALWWGRGFIKKQLLPRIPQVGLSGWEDLKTLTIDELLYLLELRITSLLSLTSSVFMDRIKSLIYRQVFGDKTYEGKRISNRIDRLINRDLGLSEIAPLSTELRKVIIDAMGVPTTLWFDNEHQLSTLAIAGQATVCFNLMQYIVRQYGEKPDAYPPSIKELWDDLNLDWKRLNSTPSSLLDDLLPGNKLR